MIKSENYVTIQGWMVADLGLKGNELLIYAIIYGFTQATNQTFKGTLLYLSEWTNSTVRGVQKSINSLIAKNLIVKNKSKNTTKCEYIAIIPSENINKDIEQSSTTHRTKFHQDIEQSSVDMEQSSETHRTKFRQDIEQSSTNNIYNNNIDIYIDRERGINTPTLEDVKAYCLQRNNNVNPERFYNYYTSIGWLKSGEPIQDWRAVVRTWETNDFAKKDRQAKIENERNKRCSFDVDMLDNFSFL